MILWYVNLNKNLFEEQIKKLVEYTLLYNT